MSDLRMSAERDGEILTTEIEESTFEPAPEERSARENVFSEERIVDEEGEEELNWEVEMETPLTAPASFRLRNPEMNRKEQDLELLLLRKATRTDRRYSIVPKPREPLPTNPLPRWHLLKLDEKLPMVPAPRGSILNVRNQVSKPLFLNKKFDFDLSDPYIRETPKDYVPLHDPHLKYFFQTQPNLFKRLVRLGLLTPTGEVTCTLADLNKYRLYLGRIHKLQLGAERQKEEDLEKCERKQRRKLEDSERKEIRLKRSELRILRRLRILWDNEQRAKMLRAQLAEHPSNLIAEKRAYEQAIQKQRRELKRYYVALRLEAIREAQKKRMERIILHIVCEEDFSAKLRSYLCAEKSVNQEADLKSFVENKRQYQEEKVRYHRALVRREIQERKCRVEARRKKYNLMAEKQTETALKRALKVKLKQDRELYLMRKYGGHWLAVKRRSQQDKQHQSNWRIRNTVQENNVHLKGLVPRGEGGGFTGLLGNLFVGRSLGAKADPLKGADEETKALVQEVMASLVTKTYKDLIRSLSDCLVNYIVEKAGKRIQDYVCREGIDPRDLRKPTIPVRKRNQIRLEHPQRPCTGPCAQFGKGSDWMNKCEEMTKELDHLRTQLRKSLEKKLVGKFRGGLNDGDDWDQLRENVHGVESNMEMETAIDTVAGITMDRVSPNPATPAMQNEFTDFAAGKIVKSVTKGLKLKAGIPAQTPGQAGIPAKTPAPAGIPAKTPGQATIPAKTPASAEIRAQTPGKAGITAKTPGQAAIPAKTKAPAGIPAETAGQAGIPAETAVPGGIPAETPGQAAIPAKTPAPAGIPAETPAQAATPAKTPMPAGIPSKTPGQAGIPAETPGQVGIPAETPGQVGISAETGGQAGIPSKTPAPAGIPAETPGKRGIPAETPGKTGIPAETPGKTEAGIPAKTPASAGIPAETPGQTGISAETPGKTGIPADTPEQAGIPGQAGIPAPPAIPAKTPAPAGNPAETPGQAATPAKTPTPAGIPAKTPGQAGIPSETTAPTGIPAETPGQAGIPAGTPGKAATPAETPGQAAILSDTSGQTGIPAKTPGQEGIPAETPGQAGILTETKALTGIPGKTPGQEGIPAETPEQVGIPAETPGQAGIPTKTKAPTGIPAKTPAQTEIPAETPGQEGIRSETPARTGIPAETPGQVGIPSDTPGQTGIPAETRGQEGVTAETPGQAAIPSETPGQKGIPAETPGQEGILSETPGQTGIPGETPGQTGIPGKTPGQDENPSETPGQAETPGQEGIPSATTGQKGIPGQAASPSETPGQEGIPLDTPGHAAIPSKTPGQTGIPAETPIQEGIPSETPGQAGIAAETPGQRGIKSETPEQDGIPSDLSRTQEIPADGATPEQREETTANLTRTQRIPSEITTWEQGIPAETSEQAGIPTDRTMTQEIPTDGATWEQGIPAETPEQAGIPADRTMTQEIPADGATSERTEEVSTDLTRTQKIPSEGTESRQGIPAETPGQAGTPADTPEQSGIPSDLTRTQEIPTDGAPWEEIPTNLTPTQRISAESTIWGQGIPAETPADPTRTQEIQPETWGQGIADSRGSEGISLDPNSGVRRIPTDATSGSQEVSPVASGIPETREKSQIPRAPISETVTGAKRISSGDWDRCLSEKASEVVRAALCAACGNLYGTAGPSASIPGRDETSPSSEICDERINVDSVASEIARRALEDAVRISAGNVGDICDESINVNSVASRMAREALDEACSIRAASKTNRGICDERLNIESTAHELARKALEAACDFRNTEIGSDKVEGTAQGPTCVDTEVKSVASELAVRALRQACNFMTADDTGRENTRGRIYSGESSRCISRGASRLVRAGICGACEQLGPKQQQLGGQPVPGETERLTEVANELAERAFARSMTNQQRPKEKGRVQIASVDNLRKDVEIEPSRQTVHIGIPSQESMTAHSTAEILVAPRTLRLTQSEYGPPPTLSEFEIMTYNVDSSLILRDLRVARGKMDIHEGMTEVVPSLAPSRLVTVQHAPLPRGSDQSPFRHSGDINPTAVRTEVQSQLRLIRGELDQLTRTLREAGVLQDPPPPPPPGPQQ